MIDFSCSILRGLCGHTGLTLKYDIRHKLIQMAGFPEIVLFSAIMGLSIFLSMPIVLRKETGLPTTKLLNAVAIGILVFLIGDVFSDVTPDLYNGSLFGYGSALWPDVTFAVSFAAGFLILFFTENRSRTGLTPSYLALIIALGMGFQNLTEGLVFGSLGVSAGLSGAALVVLVGFILQNITEGFPIASPFLGRTEGMVRQMFLFFLIGGLPTIVGGIIGFFYNGTILDVAFDGAAIGAILYAILPMLRMLFRETDRKYQKIGYIGIFLGFLIGFLVNLI
jgi:zinc transporter, ZIP family